MWAARDRNSGTYDINFRREGDFLAFVDEDEKPFLSLKLTNEIRRASRFLIADSGEIPKLRADHGYPSDNLVLFPNQNRKEVPMEEGGGNTTLHYGPDLESVSRRQHILNLLVGFLGCSAIIFVIDRVAAFLGFGN